MPEVLIALGSNMGDRAGNLKSSLRHLANEAELLSASKVYETAPMYVENQPPFYNAAVRMKSSRSPRALLSVLKGIEEKIGRLGGSRFGPREIDLDLVAYGALAYRYSDSHGLWLQVPHPRMPERRFVLQPLADVAPDFVIPGLGVVKDLLRQTEAQRESVRTTEHALFPL